MSVFLMLMSMLDILWLPRVHVLPRSDSSMSSGVLAGSVALRGRDHLRALQRALQLRRRVLSRRELLRSSSVS